MQIFPTPPVFIAIIVAVSIDITIASTMERGLDWFCCSASTGKDTWHIKLKIKCQSSCNIVVLKYSEILARVMTGFGGVYASQAKGICWKL